MVRCARLHKAAACHWPGYGAGRLRASEANRVPEKTTPPDFYGSWPPPTAWRGQIGSVRGNVRWCDESTVDTSSPGQGHGRAWPIVDLRQDQAGRISETDQARALVGMGRGWGAGVDQRTDPGESAWSGERFSELARAAPATVIYVRLAWRQGWVTSSSCGGLSVVLCLSRLGGIQAGFAQFRRNGGMAVAGLTARMDSAILEAVCSPFGRAVPTRSLQARACGCTPPPQVRPANAFKFPGDPYVASIDPLYVLVVGFRGSCFGCGWRVEDASGACSGLVSA